jgi:hypothetical protein
MLSRKVVAKEHKKATFEMAELVRVATKRGLQFPEGNDYVLYLRLDVIKKVLEWVDMSLVKTEPNGRSPIEHMMGDCYYYGMDGPVNTELVKRRG